MKQRFRWLQFTALILLLGSTAFYSGCAGTLDKAVMQSLETSFVGKTYLAKAYLGNRHMIEYSNNSTYRRNPVGVFIDPTSRIWYVTDSGFWEMGTSGDEYELARLLEIDRDLNYESFVQGIQPGQVVQVTKIDDKNDQVILEVETARPHDASKTYEVSTHGPMVPRASRIHFMLGKEQMQVFDPALLDPMIAHLLEPVPVLTTEQEQNAFIVEQFSTIPLGDLEQITGLPGAQVLEIYYTDVLSQTSLPAGIQKDVVRVLATQHGELRKKNSMWCRGAKITTSEEQTSLEVEYELQQFTDAFEYYSPTLRASLLFFSGIAPFAKSVGTALLSDPDVPLNEVEPHLSHITMRFSYLFVDKEGKQLQEEVQSIIPVAILNQYVQQGIEAQELADNSKIFMDDELIQVSSIALDVVEGLDMSGKKTWKNVYLQITDWDHEYDSKNKRFTVKGEVKNTGTWIAKDVEVKVVGKNSGGLKVTERSTTLYGLLKPGQTESFSLTLDAKNVYRLAVSIDEWKMID